MSTPTAAVFMAREIASPLKFHGYNPRSITVELPQEEWVALLAIVAGMATYNRQFTDANLLDAVTEFNLAGVTFRQVK